jgi:hypothetical protein
LPDLVHIELWKARVDQLFDIGDCRFARQVERGIDVLYDFVIDVSRKAVPRSAYGAAVCGVDLVC